MKAKIFLLVVSALISTFALSQMMMQHGSQSTVAGGGGGVSWTEIRVDFRASGTSSGATNWNFLSGSPHASVLTIANMIDGTGASTGVGISTVATANWKPYTTLSANDATNGLTGGNSFSSNGASNAVYQSIHFNYGTITPGRRDATKPQYRISGLTDGITYTIKIAGDQGTLGFDAQNAIFTAVGATTVSGELDCGPGGGGGHTTVTNSVTLTLQSSGGIIDLWMNTASSSANGTSDLAVACGLVITHS